MLLYAQVWLGLECCVCKLEAKQRKETQNLEARKLEVMMHNNHGTFRLEKASEIFEAKF